LRPLTALIFFGKRVFVFRANILAPARKQRRQRQARARQRASFSIVTVIVEGMGSTRPDRRPRYCSLHHAPLLARLHLEFGYIRNGIDARWHHATPAMRSALHRPRGCMANDTPCHDATRRPRISLEFASQPRHRNVDAPVGDRRQDSAWL